MFSGGGSGQQQPVEQQQQQQQQQPYYGNQVAILPKVIIIVLQIFVITNIYNFLPIFFIRESFFANTLSQYFEGYLYNRQNGTYKYLDKFSRTDFYKMLTYLHIFVRKSLIYV
jgi:hypothetical protein